MAAAARGLSLDEVEELVRASFREGYLCALQEVSATVEDIREGDRQAEDWLESCTLKYIEKKRKETPDE